MSADGETVAAESAPAKGRSRRGRRSGAEGGVETRGLLLDAAEQLFSERGFYGVTTRQVAGAAGLDDAMIYYHFQHKRGLFDAVFERRARVLNRLRHESLIDYVAESHGVIDLEGALAAFLNPMIDLSESGAAGWKSYFALVAQIDNTPWGHETIHRYFDPIVQELIVILRRAIPTASDRELFWSYSFMSGAMMLSLAETGRIDHLSDGLCSAADLPAMRGRLIGFCVGGFRSVLAAAQASASSL